jgi:hypothetical membrane protein
MKTTRQNDHRERHEPDSIRRVPPRNARPASGWTPSRLLTAFGAAGPIIFLAVATLLGLLQPGYSMTTHAISELALGPHGWVQTANFYMIGLAFIAFACGLYFDLGHRSRGARGLVSALLVVSGVGLILSGVFPTDPPGAPETGTGALHNLAFLVVFFPLIAAYPFIALVLRKEPGFRTHTLVTALMPLVVFGLMFVYVGFGSGVGDPFYGVSGLIQRALITVAFGWITVTGWLLLARGASR